jgi:orotidine-5'-phosphate decarboxylase
MTKEELIAQIEDKKSFLCIGLDTDIKKIPGHLLKTPDPVFEFNKQIIDATSNYCVAYKPNLAFYESMGPSGLQSLQKTIEYIPENIFTIADAKRGDIGNTSSLYARAFFENMPFDAVTVAPYMGEDSVRPFLDYEGKWVILLALTSNQGSHDFQELTTGSSSKKLYEVVLEKSKLWGNDQNMMYVVGATKAESLRDIRNIVPHHFLLVPGVGAQGGSLDEVAKYAMNSDCGLLVNSSRGIIYASNETDFAVKAAIEARKLQEEMEHLLDRYL